MDKELATRAADVLKAVAHPIRLQIVELLEDGELCVGSIADALGDKQAIISQQLNIMKSRGIVATRREGAKVFYHIEDTKVIKVLSCVYDHCRTRERPAR
jgi:DNA-binding transcriptional ArsR family regulator